MRAKSLHSMMNASEKGLVHTHEIQIIVIRYVGLRASPVHLLPEQADYALHLRFVQGETIVHENAEVSPFSRDLEDILLKMAYTKFCGAVEYVPLIPTFTR